ncbi:hypothetical protein AB0M72_29450 [Nocardiopsis dassonvillei]
MLKRSPFIATLVAVGLTVFLPGPVSADGTVVCSNEGHCWVIAEDGGSPSTPSAPEGGATADQEQAEAEPQCDTESETVTCSTTGATNTVSPAQVASQAIELLPLPLPEIGLAPSPDSTALVGLPVWLWVEGQTWSEVSRTATAGSVSVTATATPDRVEWNMGDGSTVTCYNAGRPYTTGGSSSCTHTYERVSGSGPYPITATVYWDISWSGGGASGGQTLTRASESTLAVGESQAIVQ